MKKENYTTTVIGHKAPDSDSMCSAIAYAGLLNMLGTKAEAVCASKTNKETKFILDYLGNRAEEARREAATEERGDEEPAPQDAQEESPADTPAAKEDTGSAADDAAPKETKPEFDTEKAESGPESAIEEVESKLEPDTEEANSEDTEAEPAGDAATCGFLGPLWETSRG